MRDDRISEIEWRLLKAREYCASVPKRDPRRQFIGAVADSCDQIEGRIDTVDRMPLEAREAALMKLAEAMQAVDRLVATMEALAQSERANRNATVALKLAEKMEASAAKVKDRNQTGGKGRAAQLKEKEEKTRTKVLALEAEYRAKKMPERAITKNIGLELEIDEKTVRKHRKRK